MMTQAGRYEFDAQSMDHRVRARDSHLDRYVMVKRGWTEQYRPRLHSQIASLSAIHSRHLADVYDLLSLPDDTLAIVEESIEGQTLAEWMIVGATDEGDVLRTLLQIANALVDLEAAGLLTASLDAEHWRFDDEGILNLSLYPLTEAGVLEPELGSTNLLPELSGYANELALRYTQVTAKPLVAMSDPMLAGLLNGAPESGHSIVQYRQRIQAHCLRDRHRAVAVYRGQPIEINRNQPNLRLVHPSAGVATIVLHYDRLQFSVRECDGEVYRNNLPVQPGLVIDGSCVISLGASTRPWSERYFLTLDITHPEVVF
jgi:serine/threonine-protein kinase